MSLKKKDMLYSKESPLELIGSGSYGKVYKVALQENGHLKHHAVKVVQCNSPENTELALRESWALDHLTKHPNVVDFKAMYLQVEKDIKEIKMKQKTPDMLALIEATLKGEVSCQMKAGKIQLWFEMEYCNHQDLNEYLLEHDPNPALNASVLMQLAKGMAFLHQSDIIHRDLKPENILVHSESDKAPPVFKIADFGLSKVCTAGDDDVNFYERLLYSACGSDFFMAPEVFGESYTPKADVFSLGILFWAVIDRITFISSGTNKILLGSYFRTEDKEVIPISEALLKFPKLNVHDLILATSKRRPYKAGCLYNFGKSCTVVKGNIHEIRSLVGEMILRDADLRPCSEILIKKLEATLSGPMSFTRKSSSDCPTTKSEIKANSPFARKPSLRKSTSLLTNEVKNQASCSMKTAHPKKLLSPKDRVSHEILRGTNPPGESEITNDLHPRRSVRLSLKNKSKEAWKTVPILKTPRVCVSRMKINQSVKRLTLPLSFQSQAEKKLLKKTNTVKTGHKTLRVLRSAIGDRVKSLRSYKRNTGTGVPLVAVPPKKRWKAKFSKKRNSHCASASTGGSLKLETVWNAAKLPGRADAQPGDYSFELDESVSTIETNREDESIESIDAEPLLDNQSQTSPLSTHKENLSSGKLDEKLLLSSAQDDAEEDQDYSMGSSDSFHAPPNITKRISLLQQIKQTPKQTVKQLENISNADGPVPLNETLTSKEPEKNKDGGLVLSMSEVDASNNSQSLLPYVQSMDFSYPIYPAVMSSVSSGAMVSVTYTTTATRTSSRVYKPNLLRKSSDQNNLLDSSLSTNPLLRPFVSGKRKARYSSDEEPATKLQIITRESEDDSAPFPVPGYGCSRTSSFWEASAHSPANSFFQPRHNGDELPIVLYSRHRSCSMNDSPNIQNSFGPFVDAVIKVENDSGAFPISRDSPYSLDSPSDLPDQFPELNNSLSTSYFTGASGMSVCRQVSPFIPLPVRLNILSPTTHLVPISYPRNPLVPYFPSLYQEIVPSQSDCFCWYQSSLEGQY